MKFKPIVLVAGEPNSIFFEIFLKIIKNYNFKSPLILVCSKNLLIQQSSFLKQKIDFNEINQDVKNIKKNSLNKINLINVDYNQAEPFEKISFKSTKYIAKCFDIGLKIMKSGISDKFINGPISKEKFLKNKFIGITEYLAHRTNVKDFAMVIFNKNLSVSPLITHEPLKYVAKKINRINIY